MRDVAVHAALVAAAGYLQLQGDQVGMALKVVGEVGLGVPDGHSQARGRVLLARRPARPRPRVAKGRVLAVQLLGRPAAHHEAVALQHAVEVHDVVSQAGRRVAKGGGDPGNKVVQTLRLPRERVEKDGAHRIHDLVGNDALVDDVAHVVVVADEGVVLLAIEHGVSPLARGGTGRVAPAGREGAGPAGQDRSGPRPAEVAGAAV